MPENYRGERVMLIIVFGFMCFLGGFRYARWESDHLLYQALGAVDHCIEQLHGNVGGKS